jgi:hypothetical protein
MFYPVSGRPAWPAHLERSFSNHNDGYAFSNDRSACLPRSPQTSGPRVESQARRHSAQRHKSPITIGKVPGSIPLGMFRVIVKRLWERAFPARQPILREQLAAIAEVEMAIYHAIVRHGVDTE